MNLKPFISFAFSDPLLKPDKAYMRPNCSPFATKVIMEYFKSKDSNKKHVNQISFSVCTTVHH